MGGRRTLSNSPLARLHTRAVLSCDAVTRKRAWASTSMRRMGAVCMPASMRRKGVSGGCASAADMSRQRTTDTLASG